MPGTTPASNSKEPGDIAGSGSVAGVDSGPDLIVEVDQKGIIRIDGEVVTQDQLQDVARLKILSDPGCKAILFVASSQFDGIELTALLADVGFHSVLVYYPTAKP